MSIEIEKKFYKGLEKEWKAHASLRVRAMGLIKELTKENDKLKKEIAEKETGEKNGKMDIC